MSSNPLCLICGDGINTWIYSLFECTWVHNLWGFVGIDVTPPAMRDMMSVLRRSKLDMSTPCLALGGLDGIGTVRLSKGCRIITKFLVGRHHNWVSHSTEILNLRFISESCDLLHGFPL